MFRKFTPGENVSGLNQIKSSVQRGIRAKIAEQFPQLEDEGVLDELMPKKCTMVRKGEREGGWCGATSDPRTTTVDALIGE